MPKRNLYLNIIIGRQGDERCYQAVRHLDYIDIYYLGQNDKILVGTIELDTHFRYNGHYTHSNSVAVDFFVFDVQRIIKKLRL